MTKYQKALIESQLLQCEVMLRCAAMIGANNIKTKEDLAELNETAKDIMSQIHSIKEAL